MLYFDRILPDVEKVKEITQKDEKKESSEIKLVVVDNKETLNYLYERQGLCFEGLVINETNYKNFYEVLTESGVKVRDNCIYVISGEVMNECYGLTGENSYNDDFTIPCITWDFTNSLMYFRLEGNGRWFSDVIDNNLSIQKDIEDEVLVYE